MDPSAEFEKWWDDVPPMTPQEQKEILLGYFTMVLDTMRTSDIPLRAHLLKRFPPGPEQDTIMEIIDGHLALRRLNENCD